MAQKKTIIVVGGAHSGQAAAAKARQCNEEARIVLVEQGPLLGVGLKRPELKDDSAMSVLFEEDDHFGKHHDVEIKRNTKAILLDVDSRCVVLESFGKRERLSFDKLIYSGGARSKMLPLPGLYGPRVVNFRSFNDLSAIKKALSQGARRVVVVGCGYYGIEAALKLKAAGLVVTVIECKRHIMQRFSLQFSQWMVQKLVVLNIAVLLGETIKNALELPGLRFKLTLVSGQEIECDLVVVAIGIEPNVTLLQESGAALDPDGLIRVDNKMATTLPNVYACGSAVSVPISTTGGSIWIPAPAIIARTAQIAGHNAAVDNSSPESLKQFCGTLIIDIGGTSFARTGLNEQEARTHVGDENLLITTVFGSAEESLVYHPEMCVKLLVDKKKRQIIGAEVFGQSGVERRIDLLAVAVGELWAPERLIDLDMAYLKHSGPMLDPLKDAALRAKLALLENTKIISAETLALWLKSNRDFWLVDVGDAPNVSGQTAGKTLHVPLEALRERLSELDHDGTPIVLYSKSGHKSYLAQRALMQRGFYNVYHLDGGVHAFFMVAKE